MAAERRRARMERTEEVKDALTGHIETLAGIMGKLLKEADGEQWRCPQCGSFGLKRSKVGLRDAAAVVQVVDDGRKGSWGDGYGDPDSGQRGGRGSGCALPARRRMTREGLTTAFEATGRALDTRA